MNKKFLLMVSSTVALMAVSFLNITGGGATSSFAKNEIKNHATINREVKTSNEDVEQVVWENDGSLADPEWSLTTYFFGTDCPDKDMYLTTFPLSTWQKLKYNTIYLDFEPTGDPSDVQIQICDFDASHIWKDAPLKIDSEYITDKGDGTYKLSMSFYGDPVCKLDELVITGESFVPLKLYFYGDPTYQNLWANDGTHSDPSWAFVYRFGHLDHANDNECLEIFPEITFRKLRDKTFYLDFTENDYAMITITTGWYSETWAEGVGTTDERITQNPDGTYTFTINFDGADIQSTLNDKDLLFYGSGYTPLNIHYYLSECTVSFDTMGHGDIAPITLMEDSFVPKPADPVDDKGLHFFGWYQDPEFTKPWYFDDDTVYQDMTLYAKFAEDGVTSIEVSRLPYPVLMPDFPDVTLEVGSKVQVNYFSGAKEEINLTYDMIEDYRKSAIREQTITIKYDGKKTLQKILVLPTSLANDFIFKTEPIKTEFKYGEDLDLTGTKVAIVYSEETKEFVFDLDPLLVTGYDKETLGEQTLTASYPIGDGFDLEFTVTVVDYQTGITIKQAPTKLTYKYGEELDVTGGVISKDMASGASEDINLTSSMVSGYDKNKLGEQELTVTYEGFTTTFKVTVIDELTGVAMKSNPAKSVIIKGNDLDLTDAKITTSYLSGKIEDVAITAEMVSGYAKDTLGEQTITVTYGDFTTTFKVTVVNGISGISLKSTPAKVSYIYGEDLDLTGAKITVVTAETNGSIDIDITPSMVSGYDKNKLGEQTITVTYEEFTTSFDVVVNDAVGSIIMKSNPTKVEYKVGEDLDLSGAKITVTMLSGATSDIDIIASMVSGYDKTKLGKQTITVTYEGKTANFEVTVVDNPVPPTPGGDSGLSGGAIAGIVVGSLVVLGGLIWLIVTLAKKKNNVRKVNDAKADKSKTVKVTKKTNKVSKTSKKTNKKKK